jgi:hypothetical protein
LVIAADQIHDNMSSHSRERVDPDEHMVHPRDATP